MVSNTAIRQALYEKLNVASVTALLADGSAGIVHGIAPAQSHFPICALSKQSATDTYRMGGDAMRSHLWLVKGVTQGHKAGPAESIDKAVNDLLHFGTLTISGATPLFIARESDVEYTDVSEDTQFRHCGALYRLVVQDN